MKKKKRGAGAECTIRKVRGRERARGREGEREREGERD